MNNDNKREATEESYDIGNTKTKKVRKLKRDIKTKEITQLDNNQVFF